MFGNYSLAQDKMLNIIVFGAHPEDADVSAGDTSIKFVRFGHNVMLISLTIGDARHFDTGGKVLATIQRSEAEEAGKRFGVTYKVLDNKDGELMPNLNVRLQVIRLIRDCDADVVIVPCQHVYHPDHRNTDILLQDAAYLIIVPNIAPDTSPLKRNPVFLYVQDRFQKPYSFQPDIAVDISDVYEHKVYSFAVHKSQFFEWGSWINGKLDKVPEGEKEKLEWLADC